MASMNNWLGFSLSPQEGQNNSNSQNDDAYGLSNDDSSSVAQQNPISIPNHASNYSIFEALNPPNSTNSHHDWTIKGTSDLSMLVGSTSGNGMEVEEQPKLEDFLGGTTSNGYVFANYTTPCPNPNPNSHPNNTSNNNSNSTIGLSMIKSWLRNQPAPPMQAQEVDQSCANVTAGAIANGSQGLSLSMSTSETGSPMPLVAVSNGGGESSSSENNNKQKGPSVNGNNNGVLDVQSGAIEAVPRKSIDTFGQRTSIYRGVTRHRWTGRYEAHLWDNSCRREGQTRKGRQVYLGGYDKEDKAARAYDLAALKYWGTATTTNFPITNYEKELEEMKNMTRQEYVASLRRKSSGFSRGASIYRGVTRHHQHGRWQARIGRVAGNKDLYLGTFSTQEEAAEAYDIAAIKFRGLNAVTNFDMSRYDVKSILESSTLPIGGAAKRLKDVSEHTETSIDGRSRSDHENIPSHLTDNGISSYGSHHGWPAIAFNQTQPLGLPYYGQSRVWCKQEQDSSVIGAAQGLQELQQLHSGGGTHNFFNGMHGMIGMDSSDHSTGSNSMMYNGGIGVNGESYGGYAMPMGTMMVDQGQNSNQTSSYNGEHEALLASDPYGSTRNMYYLPQQQSSSSVNEQGNGCNNWIQSSVQAMAPRTTNSVTVCHGGPPLFTVWNDA